MATSLDMSLDDLIKNRGQSERVRGRGRARRGRGNGRATNGGRIPGGVRRGPLSVNARPSSYTIAKSFRRIRPFPWQRDLLEDSLRASGISGIEIGTKRGRGRPPKAKDSLSPNAAALVPHRPRGRPPKDPNEPPKPPKVKVSAGSGKPRGRPRKMAKPTGGLRGLTTEETAARKPRGRPPKVKEAPLTERIWPRPFPWQRDLLEDSLRASGISGIEIGTKRGRGRPPKAKDSLSPNAASLVPRRPRGRLPKDPNEPPKPPKVKVSAGSGKPRGQPRKMAKPTGGLGGSTAARKPRGRPPKVKEAPLTERIWLRPFPWQRDLLEDSLRASGISGIEIGTKRGRGRLPKAKDSLSLNAVALVPRRPRGRPPKDPNEPPKPPKVKVSAGSGKPRGRPRKMAKPTGGLGGSTTEETAAGKPRGRPPKVKEAPLTEVSFQQ